MNATEKQMEVKKIKNTFKKEERKLLFERFVSNKLMMIGSIILLLLILITTFVPVFISYDPYAVDISKRLMPPSAEHFLGTDDFGRDLLIRVAYGGRVSIGIGLAVTAITTILGVTMGLIASYYRILDNILMRISDGLIAFPSILLAIAMMAALGAKTQNVIFALSIVYTPYVARIVRSSALSIMKETYIEAIKAQGANSWRIIWRHIFPNTISPLIVQATFIFAESIIAEASLSFLGAGVPAPQPSWGSILHEGKDVIVNGWWMVIFSGSTIALIVLSLNLLGDGLRDLLDPHIRSSKRK